MQKLTITTKQEKEIVDLTKILNDLLMKNGHFDGLLFLSVSHTTCSVTTADLDPGGTDKDYLDAITSIMPKLNYKHPHNPEHVPDHIASSIIGTSCFLQVQSGSIVLGQYQKVVLIELNGPGDRRLNISFLAEKEGI